MSGSKSVSPFLFLAFQYDERLLESSIEFSFEKSRLELASLMQTLSAPLSKRATSSIYFDALQRIVSRFHSEITLIPPLWEDNERLLRLLLSRKVPFVYCIANSVEISEISSRKISSYDSFHQLLIHIERDWGEGGKAVRQRSYTEGVLHLIQKYLPLKDSKILVPGAGVGRLAVELMVGGYRVEANECSGIMIRVMNSLLTEIIPSEQKLQYYPYLHFNPTDEWDHNRRFQSSLFPSSDTVHISKWLKQESFFSSSNRPRFTVQSGDFLSVYSPQFHVENSTHSRYQENSFDAVVTSFFLDTGTDLIDYLITIHYLLRSGGIWVNSGPLHYHSVTDTPYSYAIIRELIQSLGFVSLENTIIESSYCGEEENFMKPEYYRYPLEVWQLEKSEYPSVVPTYPLSAENDSQRFVLRNFGTL